MLKCGKGIVNSLSKAALFIMLTGGLFLLPAVSHAQGGDLPCGGDDPTTSVPCPLDTWVWVLVAAAVIFGAVYLQRREKLQGQS